MWLILLGGLSVHENTVFLSFFSLVILQVWAVESGTPGFRSTLCLLLGCTDLSNFISLRPAQEYSSERWPTRSWWCLRVTAGCYGGWHRRVGSDLSHEAGTWGTEGSFPGLCQKAWRLRAELLLPRVGFFLGPATFFLQFCSLGSVKSLCPNTSVSIHLFPQQLVAWTWDPSG